TNTVMLTDPADIAVGSASTEITALNPNSYYTFTIAIHTGNLARYVSTTARLYIPPAIVGDVTTTLNAAKNGAMLSWTNAPNIGMAGVEVIYREYVDATATEPLAVIDEQFARTDSVKAEDATINVPMDIFSPSPAVLLNSNRYYTFTVTPIYVDDGGETDGPVSAPSARQYFPPAAAVNDLSAALSADKTSVVLSWSNPQSAAAITSVRVTRNEFVDATTTVPATSLDTTDYMDASAVVSSATGTAAATLEIPVLTPNRYYTFTVTPIYDGGNADIVGFTTAPSNRQYLPPPIVGSATATLNAATSAASTGIVVSWTNPQSIIGIESIKVSRQAYLTLDGDDMTGSVEPTILTDPAFLTAGAASTDLAGFATDRYYTFTVTPIYAGNIEGPTSAATNPRVILLGVPGVRDLSAAVAAAQVRLTWTNPPDVRNITITQTTGSGPEIEILSNSAVANLIKQGSEAIHYVQGLSGSEEFVLKVIPTYPGDVDGSASATATLRLRPGHSDFDDVLDTADIDVDGDGLIELDNVNDLNRMRDDLAGASFAGSTSGCGGDVDSENNPITSCKGYELTAPVDLNELEPDTSLSNWQPVGGCASENATSCLTNAFTGSFDGNNHKISNLRLMLNRSAYGVGLFGAVDNSQLDNIVLRDVSITSSADGDFLGSLVGYANNAIITRSAVDIRSINAGSTNFVGGLVGYANATNVVSAISIGNSITGKLHIGGLLGACTFGCVTSSSFAAVTNMSALLDIGGLVGYANHHGGKIIFSGAATNNLIATFSSIGGVLGLLDVGVEPFQFFSASYAILNGLRSRGGAGPLYTSIPESSFPVGQSIYYNDKIDRNFPSYPLAPLYLAFSRLQPAAFADNGNGADFTQWQYAWCDTATGEFTEDRSSDLATGLNINGVNAWDLVPDNSVMRTDMTNNFPVPACTPFSPATIRAAIGKVRLGEGPVSLD
ncbi:MAG: hypothetical protein K0U41_09195, partial [Gammaproteobacteria bacterium]|nr:hypothetical protein [Gammaproteobacteria bacterium]